MSQPRNSMVEQFPAEYFSGCDVKIYFDDVLIDDIVQLKFTMQEQVMPVYGYNSYKFDDVFRGAKLIQGTFVINFKTNGYLKRIVDDITSNNSNTYNPSQNEDQSKSVNVYGDEELKNAFYEDGREFQDAVENNEEFIWGNSNENEGFQHETGPTFSESGFDIKISYGNYQGEGYGEGSLGTIRRQYNKRVNNGGTVKALNGVYLTGTAQTIEMSGQPVKEVYTFIANDIDRSTSWG